VVLGKSQANRRGEEITSLVVGFDEKITSEELTRIVVVVVVVAVVFFFFYSCDWIGGKENGMDRKKKAWDGGEE